MAEADLEKPLLDEWRQGDFTLGDIELPYLASDFEGTLVEFCVTSGVALISQTCDVIRNQLDRPYVQVAALVPATPGEIVSIKGRSKPRYAYLPGLEAHGLVVDLDVTATVSKETAAGWRRQSGFNSEFEQRQFAEALARHKQRFAFPDNFSEPLKRLKRWIERRKDKSGDVGVMIRSLDEIRARCAEWASASPEVEFLLILAGDPEPELRMAWAEEIEKMELLMRHDFPEAIVRMTTWRELSADEFRTSERLDFDGLSGR